MSLSHDQILRLARLARISVRGEEAEAVAARLNRVMSLVDELRKVDTSGVEPMAHPLDAQLSIGQRLRADEVADDDARTAYQQLAPDAQDGLYRVPKVLE
jgi:aspartyl-tRNA(Asn)/glutamyl-tRNA(Gln) amidotransferase subunit C